MANPILQDDSIEENPPRVCRTCGCDKLRSDFPRESTTGDGWSWHCRECRSKKNKAQYARHAEKRREYARRYGADHSEQRAEYRKKYYAENKERLLAYLHDWRKTHKTNRSAESIARQRETRKWRYANDPEYRSRKKARAKAFRQDNPEKVRSGLKRWVSENRDRVLAYQRNYQTRWKTPEEWKEYNAALRKKFAKERQVSGVNYRERRENAPGQVSNEQLNWLHQWQDHRCFYCNKDLAGKEHIEHIIPLDRGGSNNPRNIVLACSHCNLSKQARFYAIDWEPSEVVSLDRFHAVSLTRKFRKMLAERSVRFQEDQYLTIVNGKEVIILSTFAVGDHPNSFSVSDIHARHPAALLFYDYEFLERPQAILNVVLAKAKISENIGARKLELVIPPRDEAKAFMDEWHVKGGTTGAFVVALRDDQGWRGTALLRPYQDGYDLVRLTFKNHISGGMTRLLSSLDKMIEPESPIYAFVDTRFADGSGHLPGGFRLLRETPGATTYSSGVGLFHSRAFSKSNLPLMLEYYDAALSVKDNLLVNGMLRVAGLPLLQFKRGPLGVDDREPAPDTFVMV